MHDTTFGEFLYDQRYAKSTNLKRHLDSDPGGLQKKCKSTQGKPSDTKSDSVA